MSQLYMMTNFPWLINPKYTIDLDVGGEVDEKPTSCEDY